MKKIAILIISVICLTFCFASCSEKVPDAKSEFLSPSVIPVQLGKYISEASKIISDYSSDKTGTGEFAYTEGEGEDRTVIKENLDASYDLNGKTLSFSACGKTVSVSAEGLFINGDKIDHPLADFKALYDKCILSVCGDIAEEKFTSASDSLRSVDHNIEVSIITLKLKPEEYKGAVGKLFSSLSEDAGFQSAVKELISVYTALYSSNKSDDLIFNNILTRAKEMFEGDGELIWQRFVTNGETLAAKLTVNGYEIRYICKKNATVTEITADVIKDGVTAASLVYNYYKAGTSDSYTLRFDVDGETVTFDGKTGEGRNSGRVEFEIRSAGGGDTKNGIGLSVLYDYNKSPKYSGEGFVIRDGVRTGYDFSVTLKDGKTEYPAIKSGKSISAGEGLDLFIK